MVTTLPKFLHSVIIQSDTLLSMTNLTHNYFIL